MRILIIVVVIIYFINASEYVCTLVQMVPQMDIDWRESRTYVRQAPEEKHLAVGRLQKRSILL